MKAASVTLAIGLWLAWSGTAVAQHAQHPPPPQKPRPATTPAVQNMQMPPGHNMPMPTQAPGKPGAPRPAEQPATPFAAPRAQAPAPAVPLLRTMPRIGQWRPEGPSIALEELQRLAAANNPTLRQAESEIAAARGRRRQAGLWPNPAAGYTGEEIRGGTLGGGQHGGFVEQTIVLGRKLQLGQRVFEKEITLAELEREEQRLRVDNGVKLAFFQTLATQELVSTRRQLAHLAADNYETATNLRRLGAADETEVLQAGVEMQRAELALVQAENNRERAWRGLAAVAGKPGLPLMALAGRLDELPPFDEERFVGSLLTISPAVKIAEANIERADARVTQARRQAVPDLRIRAGLLQNYERLEPSNRPIGLQAQAEVGVQLPIFNRNQGNVDAARAERERAQLEAARIQLLLRERAAGLVRTQRNARAAVARYQQDILPAAEQSFNLMYKRWGEMAASYPQLLIAQRTLLDVHTDYIRSLEQLWTSSITLEGFLLTDGLEAPSRPSEVDQPVREINLPSSLLGGGEQ